MARSYKKEEILNELEEFNDIELLYTIKNINRTGKTNDTKEKYTEIIAREILENTKKYNFDKIDSIHRTLSYNIGTHNGKFNKKSPRREENIAMMMYNKKYPVLGKIIDYQVPLKDSKHKKAGKIDLISYNEKNNILHLIELKNDYSKETLLRCVLEILTYSKQVDEEKLKNDFRLVKEVKIKPAILIFEDTKPFANLNDFYVNKLIEKYNISIFIVQSEEKFNIINFKYEQS